MITIIAINIVFAAVVLAAVLGLIARSIATAQSDRGVTLVRRVRRPQLGGRPRRARGEVGRAWPAV